MPPLLRRSMLAVLAGVLAVGTVGAVHQVAAAAGGVDSTFQAAAPLEVTPTRFATRVPATRAVDRAPVKPARVALEAPPDPRLCVGAAAMTRPDCPPSTRAVPMGQAAWADLGPAYEHDCVTLMPWERDTYRRCRYYAGKHGKKNKDWPSIAIVGNSHAIHYLPPLLALAEKNHWRVTTYFANKCFPTTVPLELFERESENCLAWGKWVLADTKAGDFDLVITSNRQGAAPLGVDRTKGYPLWKKGYTHFVDSWLEDHINVLVIRDNPFPGLTHTTVPDCVAAHAKDFRVCAAPREAWLRPDPLAEAALDAKSPRAQVADLTSKFCTDLCLPVIGNTLVYRDESHLTATYARTLAPYLGPYVKRALAAD